MATRQPITIVVGGQYGSEAKGAIAAYIGETENVHYAVRTGAVNAGHSVYYNGTRYAMQQLPVGWTHPGSLLVIGAGALIHPPTLLREVSMISEVLGYDVRARLVIDHNAGTHLDIHTERSAASGRHHDIGATGKGCSEAIIDRIRGRNTGYKLFRELNEAAGFTFDDTAARLNRAVDAGAKVLLEATQGTLLDLYFGPYPYTTHKPTGPAVWMAECGLSPALPTDIVMVVRTYPIRVAGNSGPMPDEINWVEVAKYINDRRRDYDLSPIAIVACRAVCEFEAAVRTVVAQNPLMAPEGSDGLDQHRWTPAQRVEFKHGLSEINKMALESLPDATVAELSKLFELTTVTKKLRRVARLNHAELRRAAVLVRPHRVALTFMNYEFPEHWGVEDDGARHMLTDEMSRYINGVEASCGAPVTMTSWGPESKHILHHE